MRSDDRNTTYKNNLIAQYKFNDADNVGKDSSGQGNDATASGIKKPSVNMVGAEHL